MELSAHNPTQAQASPQLDIIHRLHRGGDGFVTFHRKISGKWIEREWSDGEWVELFAVPVGELSARWPKIRKFVTRDAYLSINSYFQGWGKSSYINELPNPRRESDALRYLNACFVDLDIYKAGLTIEQAKAVISDMQARGQIPAPSIIAESGRGIWLLWLLCDADDRRMPQQAWPEKVDWYRRIQAELKKRLARLAPDAIDPVRVCRVPGSINPKSGTPVVWLMQGDAQGNPPTYTLAELGEFLEVPEKKSKRGGPSASKEGAPKNPNKQKAYRVMQAKRLRQFETLRRLRGGFSKGCRNHAAMLYVSFLRANTIKEGEIEQRLEALAAECSPPSSSF